MAAWSKRARITSLIGKGGVYTRLAKLQFSARRRRVSALALGQLQLDAAVLA